MATSKTVDLSEFARVLGADVEEDLDKLKTAAVRGIQRSLPKIVEDSPVDTGQYAASWGFNETERGAIIGNFAPHAAIIEEGARPFTPPIKPLLAWAKRVLKDPSQPPEYSDEVWRLAKGTQKKIAEYGMQPQHILEKNIPYIIDNIRKEFEKL